MAKIEDDELRALATIVRVLDPLNDDARERITCYLIDRFHPTVSMVLHTPPPPATQRQ